MYPSEYIHEPLRISNRITPPLPSPLRQIEITNRITVMLINFLELTRDIEEKERRKRGNAILRSHGWKKKKIEQVYPSYIRRPIPECLDADPIRKVLETPARPPARQTPKSRARHR